jgi:hypothetical protein
MASMKATVSPATKRWYESFGVSGFERQNCDAFEKYVGLRMNDKVLEKIKEQ